MENPRPKVRWTVFAVIALLALAVRLPQLDQRPMHTDEAVNAYITGDLLAGKSFHYDPQDRHGPLLYFCAKPIAQLCGAKSFSELTETKLRLGPVIVSSLTVLLFGAGVESFGFGACVIAALLFAFAPLPIYYNRYFIHETLFVAATFGLILCGGRALKNRTFSAAALAGLCAGLMLATKETAVLNFFALGIAAVCCRISPRSSQRELAPIPAKPGSRSVRLIGIAIGVFAIIIVLLFSWFGHNWAGLADLFRAIPQFANRAGGQGHEKPFWYYTVLLANGWSGPTLLAVAIAGLVIQTCDFIRQRTISPMRFIALYGIVIVILYSAIPYKTPWLALNFWLPMSLLIGMVIVKFLKNQKSSTTRWLLLLPAALLVTAIAHDVDNRVFRFPADENNPYAYAHTVENLLGLPTRLKELAKAQNLASPRIAIVSSDPWPLPWYLRKFSQVGFWKPGEDPGQADFFITSPEAAETLANKLSGFKPEFFGLRPEAVVILWERAAPATRP